MPEDRYPKKLFSQDWNIKPHRGRQRKVWSRIINDLFVSLELEWLKDGSSSLKALAWESISERESKRFEEGLNTKVKLTLYKTFGKAIEFKKYLHGVADAGSRLLTLAARMRSEGYCSWVCLSVCAVCLLLYISPLECLFISKTIPST